MATSNNSTVRHNPVTSNEVSPLVIIDTMNGFFRWYDTSLRRLNKSRKLPNNTTVEYDDKIGMSALNAAFETTFRGYVRDLLRMTHASLCNVLMALDCRRSQIWRNDFTVNAVTRIPTYKGNRRTRNDPGISATIRFMLDDMLPRLLPNQCIGVPHAEADDIIAVITRLVNARSPKRAVCIVSDDSDFIQLLDHDTNEVYTQRHERTRDRCRHSARTHLLIKIIGGDYRDNIRPAFPGCTQDYAERLASSPRLLENTIAAHGDTQFASNRNLIDFDFIPPRIKSRIIERTLLVRVQRRHND